MEIVISQNTGSLWNCPPAIHSTGLHFLINMNSHVQQVAFNSSGSALAVVDVKGNLADVRLGQNEYKIAARGCVGPTAMTYIDPGDVAIARSNGTIGVHSTEQGLQKTLKGHRRIV